MRARRAKRNEATMVLQGPVEREDRGSVTGEQEPDEDEEAADWRDYCKWTNGETDGKDK